MNYKVTKEDLIGDIKDFPIEVVQRMVDIRIEQGHTSGISVFQKDKDGGFSWIESPEGVRFWGNIIYHYDFDLFFKKYPNDGRSDSQIETIEIDGKKYNKQEVLAKINELKEIK